MIGQTGDVLVVGAGPTGLTLAAALRHLGVSVTLIEASKTLTAFTKATNLMQGTQEQLAAYGVMPRMQRDGGAMKHYMMYLYGANLSPRNMHLRESPFQDVLFLGQDRIEANLGDWLRDVGQNIDFEHRLASLSQDYEGVTAVISANEKETSHRFQYVVGCDGPRSVTRTFTKCDFQPVRTGKWVRQIDARLQWKRLKTLKQMWLFYYDAGFAAVIHLPGGVTKFMTFETMRPGSKQKPTLEEMQARLREVSGDASATLTDETWSSCGELLTGVAPALVDGRILLAGDAGNPILPNGGQGLNTGIQDALNLAWKLADVIKGQGSALLLQSYEAERRSLRLSLEKVQRFVLDKTIDGPRWFRWFSRYCGPFLLDRAWHSVARTFGQLNIHYKGSLLTVEKMGKKGVGAGHRIVDADVVACSTDQEVSLFNELSQPGWKCLLFDSGQQLDSSFLDQCSWKQWITIRFLTASTYTTYPCQYLYYDIDGLAHKQYGVSQPTLLLIRPDNYIGLRTHALKIADVESYLNHWFTPGASRAF